MKTKKKAKKRVEKIEVTDAEEQDAELSEEDLDEAQGGIRGVIVDTGVGTQAPDADRLEKISPKGMPGTQQYPVTGIRGKTR